MKHYGTIKRILSNRIDLSGKIKQLTGKRKEFLPTASQTLAETPGLSLIQ